MNKFKKLNLKQRKYTLPLIILPFLLFVIYQIRNFTEKTSVEEEKQEELSTSLGEVEAEILNKNEAYDKLFKNPDSRTNLEGLEEEFDSTYYYTDQYSMDQKRIIDSITAQRKLEESLNRNYTQPIQNSTEPGPNYSGGIKRQEDDFERQKDIMDMLYRGNIDDRSENGINESKDEEEPYNHIEVLKEQMFFLDSLEAANNPEKQKELKIQEKLKADKEKWNAFMKSTLRVNKGTFSNQFNTISNNHEQNTIKAIIDENTKGYLGSRIRIRLLEEVNVGKHKIPVGTLLYAQITGFNDQRVNLNILSIYYKDQILPVNLTICDVDGWKGLYVPQSNFREMMKEMGTTSVQGQQIDFSDQSFTSSLFSGLFSSTSNSIASLIRKNKAKLKYNSYILLINEKDLQNETR